MDHRHPIPVIDAHAHLLRGAQGFGRLIESGAFESVWLMDLDGAWFPDMDLADSREILQAVRDFPGRVHAFGRLDLEAPVDRIDRLREDGFVGLKPYKPRRPWGHEAYFPHYRRAADLGMPVLFHTGLVAKAQAWTPGAGEGVSGGVSVPPRGFGPENMRPGHLAGIAEAFPDLTILGGHLGWPWLAETEQNLYYYPNIHHDVSGYLRSFTQMPELLDRRAHDGTDRYFNEKLHFATDVFYGSEEQNARALKLRDFWTLWFELVGGLYYRWGQPAERDKFFHGNAARIQARWTALS